MVEAILSCMQLEVNKARFIIVDPDDGKYEKRRIVQLILCGILTSDNCPLLVPPPAPKFDDYGWRFMDRSDLKGLPVSKILYEWNAMFHGENTGHLVKGFRRFKCGKAYYCRVLIKDENMFVTMKIDRSQIKGCFTTLLTFRVAVGRNSRVPPELLAAKCSDCTVGSNHPGCAHIITTLTALTLLNEGICYHFIFHTSNVPHVACD